MGINEENSTKWLNYNRSHLLCPDLSQCWLENIRMTFSDKNDTARCSSVTLPFHQVRTDPEVSVKEENYAFLTLFFSGGLQEPSFISRGFAQFNWHSCTVASLEVLFINFFDVESQVLDIEILPQHISIANLSFVITYYCFVQSGEAFMMKGNKHMI